jgi:hypothetical protein
MGAATTRPLLAPGQLSQFAHRLAPVAGVVSVTALLVVSMHQLLKPPPQIRSCAQVIGGYGSQGQLRCIHEPGDAYKVVSPSLTPRGSIEVYLAPEASAAEGPRP